MSDANYTSGDDYVVEFLGYRFSFNAIDFEQRVNAAAVRLRLVEPGELEEAETSDLVDLTANGRIDDPQSSLGEYLVRHWERVALVNDESLVYWLRKLIFRGAWLDQRVKENLLEVDWDQLAGARTGPLEGAGVSARLDGGDSRPSGGGNRDAGGQFESCRHLLQDAEHRLGGGRAVTAGEGGGADLPRRGPPAERAHHDVLAHVGQGQAREQGHAHP